MKLLQLLSDEHASVRLINNMIGNGVHGDTTVVEFLDRWPTSESRIRRGGMYQFGKVLDSELQAILQRHSDATNQKLKMADPQPLPWID